MEGEQNTVNIIFYLFAKVNVLGNELEESKLKLEESERKGKCKEEELLGLAEHIDDLKASNEYLSNSKIKLDTDLNLISVSDFFSIQNYKVFILGRFGRSKQCSQGSR
jgi:hypothetical protein